ncbi:MAG: GNAT family N-acetyltransferase [Acidimicrobiales bacterium]
MATREAGPADVDEITLMMHEHAAYEGAADRCRFNSAEATVAMFGPGAMLHGLIATPAGDPGGVAGCALWYPTFSSWAGHPGVFLEDLYVRPAFRRQGLGRELLEALRALTTGRVEWDVRQANESAQIFYESLGAVRVSGWLRFRWVL